MPGTIAVEIHAAARAPQRRRASARRWRAIVACRSEAIRSIADTSRSSSVGSRSSMNRPTRASDGERRSGQTVHATTATRQATAIAPVTASASGDRTDHSDTMSARTMTAAQPSAPRTAAFSAASVRHRARTRASSSAIAWIGRVSFWGHALAPMRSGSRRRLRAPARQASTSARTARGAADPPAAMPRGALPTRRRPSTARRPP